MFDLEGRLISKFGKQGNKDGEFNKRGYLSVNKQGLLMVCDSENYRVEVFELSGKFVTNLEVKVVGEESLSFQFLQQVLVMEG